MSNPDTSPSLRRRAPIPRDECPMALAAEILGDKWTLLILREAIYGVKRYDDMRLDTGAPRAMISDRLARLVAAEILEKVPYQEAGDRARHAYRLTPKGLDLAPVMMAMTQWGEAHVTGQTAPVELVQRSTGQPAGVAFVASDTPALDPRDVILRLRKEN